MDKKLMVVAVATLALGIGIGSSGRVMQASTRMPTRRPNMPITPKKAQRLNMPKKGTSN